MDDQAILDQFNFLSKKLSDIGTALQNDIAAVKAEVDTLKAGAPAPEPKTLTIPGPIVGTLA